MRPRKGEWKTAQHKLHRFRVLAYLLMVPANRTAIFTRGDESYSAAASETEQDLAQPLYFA